MPLSPTTPSPTVLLASLVEFAVITDEIPPSLLTAQKLGILANPPKTGPSPSIATSSRYKPSTYYYPLSFVLQSFPLVSFLLQNPQPNSIMGAAIVANNLEEVHLYAGHEVVNIIRSGQLTVEEYAHALLNRIDIRDQDVKAWAFIDREYVIRQAKALDAIPLAKRGPLHGLAIGVKDVMYTKGIILAQAGITL